MISSTRPSHHEPEGGRPIRTARGAAASAYLRASEAGLVLLESDGSIALCSAEAERLLGIGPGLAGRPLRALLAAFGREASSDRRVALLRLRGPLARGEPATIAIERRGAELAVTCEPLSGAGWAVVIEEAEHRARRLEGAVDGPRDGLTELPNRGRFLVDLERARERLRDGGAGFAVLAVDLDRFKQVNDTLGHPVGDALLRKVAERLQSTLRPTDTVARFGGDEFAVLRTEVPGSGTAEDLARHIVDLIGRAYILDGHLVNIGASVGVALAPADGAASETPETLLKHADLALYRAKADGRGAFRFFEPEMDARMQARRSLEIDLRKALALGEFELHYQPQVNLGTDRISGCEALIRWRHPARGLVSPAEFIPLAEELGLIVPIGEWVVRTACREAARWPDDLSVAVNLSPAQFKSPKLVATVAAALATSGLAPRRLEVEITEGVLLQQSAANLATLHALRDLGLRVSMDDFGTGYSSLSYLRSFPFDKIKIDRSFVSGSPAEAGLKGDPMAIVRAIASLGASLGICTVAEGVETDEQMARIRREGCTDVQGYLTGRPVPAADIFRTLAEQARSTPDAA